LGFWILYEEMQILNKTKNGARRTPIFHLPRGSWAEPTETTLPVLASLIHRSKKARLHDLAGPFALTKGMVAEEYQDDPDLSTWAEDLRDDPEPSEDDEALPLLADLLARGSDQTLSEQAQLHVLGPTAVPPSTLDMLWRLRESGVPEDRKLYLSALRADNIEEYVGDLDI
jgi:hypothetical protein